MGRRCRGRAKKKRGGGKSPSERSSKDSGTNTPTFPIDINTPLAFDMGARVECPNLGSRKGFEDASSRTGTVVEHWARLDCWPEGLRAAYRVRLDCGRCTFCHNTDDFIQETDVPPIMIFSIGSRVECKLGETDDWFPGTILQSNDDWAQRDCPPFLIKFDYGRERHFWGPQDCIRESNVAAPKKTTELRFKVGDRVDCSVGGKHKRHGTVIKTNYREDFENGHAAPYQIQLDEGRYIYAPVDRDECVKKSNVPPPSCWICFDNEQSETNLIVRECACRGGHNGFVHVDCLVELAVAKVDKDKEPDISDDLLPFMHCITCKQSFETGSHCHSALTKAFYLIHKDDDIGSTWNKMATTMMSELLVHNEDYEDAMELLQERIASIRSKIKHSDAQDESVINWMTDLSNFLVDIAAVYEATDSLEEMKVALDESLALIEIQVDYGAPTHRKVNVLAGLGKHAELNGDKIAALEYMDEALLLARERKDFDGVRLSNLLFNGGILNIESEMNRERGLAQMSESVEIMTRLYGHDNMEVRSSRRYLQNMREGVPD